MSWTDERIERLKTLWTQGLSASQIAARMGGVTRNAVIGKIHRLGLTGRVTPQVARPRPQRKRKAAVSVVQFSPPPAVVEPAPEPEPIPEIAAAPGKRHTILTISDKTCKWPIGDPKDEDFHFCGRTPHASMPYCRHHARIAYQPVQDRRRQRAAVAGNLSSAGDRPKGAGRPATVVDPAVAEKIIETVADVAGIPITNFIKPDCKLPTGAFWRKISVYFLKQAGFTHAQVAEAVGRTKQGVADALQAIDRYPTRYEAALAQVGARL